jgi:hypothetical protein
MGTRGPPCAGEGSAPTESSVTPDPVERYALAPATFAASAGPTGHGVGIPNKQRCHFDNDSGADRTRTDDFLLAKQALYQLSYGPIEFSV